LTRQIPIQQAERTIIVDLLRGFALFGVLLANFSSMLTNNVPQPIIDAHASAFDQLLDQFHDIFIRNKFITLFSILFGYGFGVIMERLEKKQLQATDFFLRRMFWLFIFGCINLALWNGDILHIYAMTGIFLLLFRKQSTKRILIFSIFFLILIPTAFRFYQVYFLHYSANQKAIISTYYQAYKFGSLVDVISVNYKTYLPQWVYTWSEWRDMSETLGRFLLGYYILRRQLFTNLESNSSFLRKLWKWTLFVSLLYIPLQVAAAKGIIPIPRPILYPFLKVGVLGMALFYATTIIKLYRSGKLATLMESFRNLGCMTLTNYLVQTIIYVIVFYNIGFGLLGEFSFGLIWLSSFIVYALQVVFSRWWMSRFYFGPAEWVWRQLTYKKRFKLRRDLPGIASVNS